MTDSKDEAPSPATVPATTAKTTLTPRPRAGGTLFGPIRNSYLTRALQAETRKIDAETEYVGSVGRLADTKVDTAQRVDRLRDLNAILDEDQADRDHERARKAAARLAEQAQWENDAVVAAAKQAAQVERAQHAQARATNNRKGYEEVAPLIQQRGMDLLKTGNFEVLAEMLDAQAELEGGGPATKKSTADQYLAGLEAAKAIQLDEIQKAKARGIDTTLLEQTLGRIEVDIAKAKNQPG